MLMGLFARGKTGSSENPVGAQSARIKDWARAALGTEAEFMVSEIDCGDPSCPGLETVLLILRPGRKTCAAKVGKPLAEVTEQDIRESLVGLDP